MFLSLTHINVTSNLESSLVYKSSIYYFHLATLSFDLQMAFPYLFVVTPDVTVSNMPALCFIFLCKFKIFLFKFFYFKVSLCEPCFFSSFIFFFINYVFVYTLFPSCWCIVFIAPLDLISRLSSKVHFFSVWR